MVAIQIAHCLGVISSTDHVLFSSANPVASQDPLIRSDSQA